MSSSAENDHRVEHRDGSNPAAAVVERPARAVSLEEIRQELDRAHRALPLDGAHALVLPVASYGAPDGWHEVLIAYHPALRWRVVDRDAAGKVTPIERLSGAHDLRPSAIACARDYAAQRDGGDLVRGGPVL
jgi:hypothetical protein